jgi:hypothetical protein
MSLLAGSPDHLCGQIIADPHPCHAELAQYRRHGWDKARAVSGQDCGPVVSTSSEIFVGANNCKALI